MKLIMPLIVHLAPPRTITKTMILRNSPMLREGKFISNIQPWWQYKVLFPDMSSQDLEGIAYYFDGDVSREDGGLVGWQQDMIDFLPAWQDVERSRSAYLVYYTDMNGELCVADNRAAVLGLSETALEYRFPDKVTKDIIENLESPIAAEDLIDVCEIDFECRRPRETVLEILDDLLDKGIVIEEGGEYVRLALPV
ncbi:hypothetical protein Q427_26210 [Halomonas sp. BC04]|nr:hypothetical protein Q427_26210 [Halomonas sp. BC04]